MIVRNPWLTELIWVRPFIATPCRVPRYKTTTSSSRLFRPTQTCACQHHDVARSTARVAVGRPLTAKATELPVFRAVLLTLRLAMACREFSSVPKNNAQRLTATKETASSAPSTMGKRFIVCGVVEHFRRLVCATLIRCTAFAKY
jgi:hypothetical protein